MSSKFRNNLFFIQTKLFGVLIVHLFVVFGVFSQKKENLDKDIMELGVKLTALTPEPNRYFNDLIHPCVRYLERGFAGHKWWMIATPYRGYDASIENPILFYGLGESDSEPPTEWIHTTVVEETPKNGGYNSDPCLFFDDDNGLWIFWRANFTKELQDNKCARATLGVYTKDGYNFYNRKIFAKEILSNEDREMCPIVVKFDDKILMYACHHQFTPERIPIGLTIWELGDNNLRDSVFKIKSEVKPVYKKGFDFWHFDVFKYKEKYYCVVTPEKADEVLLGRSDDGVNFYFWDTPLISTIGSGRTYFYKPSAMVLNGVFYLWTSVREIGITPVTNRLWMSQMEMDVLLKKIDVLDQEADSPSDKNISIRNITNGIEINNQEIDLEISIFSMTGSEVLNAKLNIGVNKFRIRKGIYILVTKDFKQKIIVF